MKIAYHTSVSLRKLKKSDLERYYQLVGDEAVMEYIGPAYNFQEAENELNRIIDNNRSDFNIWAAENELKEFVGIGLLQQEDETSANIGYWVLRKYWGNGYGLQIAQCLINKAAQDELLAVFAEVDIKNTASLRILEELYFEEINIRTNDLGNEIGDFGLAL
jgi:[ribosomal protein S5]-alanine N-acetyltransferase